MRWATERASRTAWAEQHEASASFSGSAHSSSVTATDPSRHQQRGDSRVDAAAHRHQRAVSTRRHRRVGARRGAERAVQRVGGQVGGVELAGRQPAQLGGDLVRADACRVEHVRALDQRHDRRAGGGHGAAARGLEAGGGHALAVDPQRDADEVTAGGAAGAAVVSAGRARAAPGGMLEVLAEGLHER